MNSRTEYSVKLSFPIEGRGLVLVPEPEIDGSAFHVGDKLSISRPDGSVNDATVMSVEILSSRNESTWVIMIPEAPGDSDLPVGSKFSMIETGDYKYDGMTVNERLFAAGLLDDFETAARGRDRPRMIDILSRVAMTPIQCEQTTDAILVNPKFYGY